MSKLISVVALSCLWSATTTLAAPSSTDLVYGETGRLDGFDPYTVHEASGRRLGDLLFESLVEVGPGSQYEASLATSWKVSPDRTFVTFELRKNVFWHGADKGKPIPFTAKDIVTTIRLLTAEASEIPNRERFLVLNHAVPRGDHQVEIHLKRAMLDPVRVMMFKVLPSHILGSVPALKRNSEFASKPIGTGPYVFESANAQGEVVLAANGNYYSGAPAIKRIVMKSYADQNVMAQSLMFNSLDLITYVSPRDLSEISGDRKLGLIPYDALSFSFFAFNTSRGILRDRRVRQAIALSVNRQEMLDAFFQGKGRLISGPFPPTSWAYNLDVKGLPYDVERAKQLLANAGFKDVNNDGVLEGPDGEPAKLLFAVPLAGESEMIKRIVLAFQGYLQQVGVSLELQFMDWLVWKKRVLGEHDYDVTIASWSFDDASNITSLFHSSSAVKFGNNFVLYRNPKVDAFLTEADATNDFDKRRAILQKLHAMLADENPYIYLWTLQHHAAHNVRLSGVRVEPFAFFRHVLSWKMERK